MKSLNLIWLSLFTVAFMFSASCKKENTGGINGVGDCSASWEVNGKKYDSQSLSLCVYKDSLFNLSSSITGGSFQLQIDPIGKPGTYVADANNNKLTVFVMIKLDDGTIIVSNNVSVNVSEISSKNAKGTFSGDFYDVQDVSMTPKYTVTNGKFQSAF